jgi:hypothetical protein
VETAFQALKKALCTVPILAYLQLRERFVVDTDASNVETGGVLSQVQDGHARVTAYYSRKLKKAERNYASAGGNYLHARGHWNISVSTSTDKSSNCALTTLH